LLSKPIHSINCSLSLSGTLSQSLNAAVGQLPLLGVIVVAAAGNNGRDACNYSPGSATGVVTVGGTMPSDGILTSPPSNYGNCVNLYAPGFAIRSTYLNGGTALMK